MPPLHSRNLSRRSILASVPLLAGGLVARRIGATHAAQVSIAGDCSVEPALQYLCDFNTLNFMALPARGTGTLEPDLDWVVAQTSVSGVVMIPPGWSLFNGFANSWDRDGVPQWTASPLPYPYWTTSVLVSPDDTAAYIHATGGIDDVNLLPEDGAQLMRELVMEPLVQPTNLCLAEETGIVGDIGQGFWISGDRYEHELLLSRGTILTSSVAGFNLGPGSTFLFDAFVAPTNEAADLVLDVYLKILYQQLPKGGAGDPTPTPTPTP